ncbi:sigma-70 family RNA polymerase sigma factor [Cellulomonas sp. 179-A 9B4 NHS]|uniref:sigma-70 family RNA polymerase sigma factor n=1 Tax=Cellulomonas sp. 179-A 9B4 NHS TaxID=3142379 RepID=UPI0039A2DD6E
MGTRARRRPAAYTRRTLVNLRTDTWRRRRREVLTAPDDLPEYAAAAGTGAVHDRDTLVRALGRLTPRQRRVVVLRHLVGLTEREVAEDLGISTGTVKSTASRALAALRADLTVDVARTATASTPARTRPEETR